LLWPLNIILGPQLMKIEENKLEIFNGYYLSSLHKDYL
jgi:hypothetical protein